MATSQKKQINRSRLAVQIIRGLCIAFLLIDALMKVVKASPSVEGTIKLGFPESLVQPLGFIVLLFTVLYSLPRTAVLGAIMLTAHLGGAVAITVQHFQGSFSFLFPLVFCVALWTGLFLRDEQLRAIIPFRS